MRCMKCGRETEENQVFCKGCLADMERSPVKAGTPVMIPKRPERQRSVPVKKENPEELLAKLNKKLRTLRIAVIVLFVALCLSVGLLFYHFYTTDHSGFGIGQNYSTLPPESNPTTR